jgi:Protein kinase domain
MSRAGRGATTQEIRKRVGRYLVLRELGSGGMATVFLARQEDLDRLVALKELNALRLKDPGFVRRFLRESRVAGSLTHPNIVTVHDYFEARGTPYIAMEYVSGGSLRPHIGHLSVPQVGGVLAGVLAGLAHAERRGVVHRDLKPENLLITDDGQVKITDFGIAKATGSVRTLVELTATGTTLGTPNYMAPEQAMGQEVGPWSDLYSVGIIAFEMLVGEAPFRDTEEPMAVLMRQVKEPVPAVSSLRPDVDRAISDWVDRMLVKDPDKRIRSAAIAWTELEEALITVLGPRWQRQAGLVEGAAYTAPAFETPPTVPLQARRTRRAPDRTKWARTVPPRKTAPTQVRPQRDGSRRGVRPWQVAALLAALLLVAGFALGLARGGSNSGSGSARPTAVTSTHELSLAVPSGWKPLARVPDTGLPLSDALALAPGGRSSGPSVAYGLMRGNSAGNSALLPPAFLASLGQPAGQLPPRTRVTLPANQLPAWRYRDLRPLGSPRQMSAYVVPTSLGVATVVCLAAQGGIALPPGECEAIASTLRLLHAKPYPIGPSDAYAAAVTNTLGELQRAVNTHGQALSRARTGPARSSAATALAGDYGRAAKRLAALQVSPADRAANARLVSALQQAGKAYATVARVARTGDTAAYNRARSAAARDEKAVDPAIAAVGAAGYSTGNSGGQGGTGAAGSNGAPAASAPSSSTPSAAGSAPSSSTPTAAPQQPCSSGAGRSDDSSDDTSNCGQP